MSGGKGGSTTSAQQIPEWIEGPAKANLEKARLAGEIGYMPYYGPEVAALSPMQKSAMQNTAGAMSAFGLGAPAQNMSQSMPSQPSQPQTNQSLVRDMYARADRMGNQVGQGEIDYWTGQLDSGALSPADFEKTFTTARNEQYKAQGLGTPRELISSSAFAQMQPEGYLPRETTMGGVTGYSSGNLYDQAVAELARRNPAQMERYNRAMTSTSDATAGANSGQQAPDPRLNPASPMYDSTYYNRVMGDGGYGGGNDGSAFNNAGFGRNQQSGSGITSMAGLLSAIIGGTPTNTPAPVTNMNSYSSDAVTDTGFGTDPSQGGYWG